jgi:tetratricopeptide (TPR) repeat protein
MTRPNPECMHWLHRMRKIFRFAWALSTYLKLRDAGSAGEWAEVIRWGHELSDRGYDLPYARLLMGIAYLHQERIEEAVAQFEQARKPSSSDHSWLVYNHAFALWKLNRFEDARRVLEGRPEAWPPQLREHALSLMTLLQVEERPAAGRSHNRPTWPRVGGTRSFVASTLSTSSSTARSA